MRRLDFEIVARAMGDEKPSSCDGDMCDQWVRDCESLADAFQQQSAAFDRDRFLRNCGFSLPPPRS